MFYGCSNGEMAWNSQICSGCDSRKLVLISFPGVEVIKENDMLDELSRYREPTPRISDNGKILLDELIHRHA